MSFPFDFGSKHRQELIREISDNESHLQDRLDEANRFLEKQNRLQEIQDFLDQLDLIAFQPDMYTQDKELLSTIEQGLTGALEDLKLDPESITQVAQ